MQYVLDSLVLIILGFISVRNLLKSFRTRIIRSVDLICGMIFIFYGLPLIYDWFHFGYIPDMFYPSWSSPRVRVIYDFVILASVILLKIGAYDRKGIKSRLNLAGFSDVPMQPAGLIPIITKISWFLLILPIPMVLLSPNRWSYFKYGAVVHMKIGASPWEAFTIMFISTICVLAILGFFIIYWVRTRQTRSSADPVRWLAVFLALIAVYIHGKRSIILSFMVIIIFVNFLEHRLKFRTILLYGILGIIGAYGYIGIAKGYERSIFDFVRGDLSRDYTLRHAIYKSTWTESEIVPYRGAGYLFTATFYIPRMFWPDKPWPIKIYFTKDVLNWHKDELPGWGFGMGFMEELIANFGYIGLLGCLVIGRFSRWLDKFIYSRSSYYVLLWFPLIYGCIFSSGVILKLVMFLVLPVFIFSKIFANPNAWIPLYDEEEEEEYVDEEATAKELAVPAG